MKVLIPIPSLIIDNAMLLGDIILIPHEYFERDEVEYDTKVFDDTKIAEIESIMDFCKEEYETECYKYTLAMFEYDFTEKEYCNPVPDEEFVLLEKLCYKVDRALDFIRLNYCQIGSQEAMPGIPGIVNGFRRGVVVDLGSNRCRGILGSVYSLYIQPGIGCYGDINSPENDGPDMYRYLFCNRNDEVYINCRTALARINEAMYMNNLNSAFVYLMSTLEMLASREYLNFKNVKSRLLPFLASSKSEYHALSEELCHISEDIRTEIVHNGKSIFDLMENERKAKKLLFRLTSKIVLYCKEVIETGIISFDDLEIEREKRKKALGI